MTHLMEIIARKPVTITGGEGARLHASDGSSFIDFFGDTGTAALGYNPVLYRDYLRKMLIERIPAHVPNLYGNVSRDNAAEALCRLTQMDKVFFCNSGTEAAEAAIKLARLNAYRRGSPERYVIASITGGFHGRTYGALAAGDGARHHYEGYGPLPEGFQHFDFDGAPLFEQTLANHGIAPRTLAAVMFAPIFGANDVRMYSPHQFRAASDFCERQGVPLIFDEVQSGSGRSGTPCYWQQSGVKPGIICLAKGLAAGIPAGAMLCETKWNAFTPGTHFSTFGGNPNSTEMITLMCGWLEENCKTVLVNGQYLGSRLREAGFKNVRGVGMIWGFDVTETTDTAFAKLAFEKGLLVGAFRKQSGAVKITPPLNITLEELDEGIRILTETHNELEG